jgi:hypothetical protein
MVPADAGGCKEAWIWPEQKLVGRLAAAVSVVAVWDVWSWHGCVAGTAVAAGCHAR